MQDGPAIATASALAAALVVLTGCAGTTTSTIDKAQQFRAHISSANYDAARAMMSDDPRRWFDEVEGEGMAWTIGPRSGPWAEWDEHFRRQSEVAGWEGDDNYAALTYRETNDYFQLLERGWVTNQNVYLFDEQGRISGLVIRGIGDRPPGRTEEFKAWARANEPVELAYLEPGGEIDPSGDHPQRYRALLNRWRRSAGLSTIE